MDTFKLNKTVLPNTNLTALEQLKQNTGGIYNNIGNIGSGISNNLSLLRSRIQPTLPSINGVVVQPKQDFMGQSTLQQGLNIAPQYLPVNNTKQPQVKQTIQNTNPVVTNKTAQFGDKGQYTYRINEQGNPYGAPIGSVASLPEAQGTGYSYQAPENIGYNYTGQDGRIYNSETGLVGEAPGFGEIDEKQLYQDKLAQYQAQIDATNASYSDILNQSRIQGQARADQNRLQQVQGGISSSPMGSAQTAGVQAANLDIEKQVQNEQRLAVANILGDVRKSVVDEVKAKREAKQKGADEYIQYLNSAPDRKKAKVASAVKQLVSQNIDISQMTPEEIKSYTDGLGISESEFTTEYNTQKAEVDVEQAKADLETRKAEANIAQSEASAASSYASAETSRGRLELDRDKMNIEKEEKIPSAEEVKQYIRKEITTQAFKDMNKKEKKDFILANGGEPSDYGY